MPRSVAETLAVQAQAAQEKQRLLRRPGQYLVSSAMGGVYVGSAVVVMLSVTGPLQAAHSPWTRIVQSSVFALALVAVNCSGAELFTGNTMTAVQGVLVQRQGIGRAAALVSASFAGNLIGSVLFTALVYAADVLQASSPPAGTATSPALALLSTLVTSNATASPAALFARGVLCNALICFAVWLSARTTSEIARLILTFSCLLAFIASGFENAVANQTLLALGIAEHVPNATVGVFTENMVMVGMGNLVGGAVLVGVSHAYLALGSSPKQPRPLPLPENNPATAVLTR